MSGTIQVKPARHYRHKVLGTRVSIFSSGIDYQNYELVTAGYTWGITDHTGSYTEGLGRVPAKTLQEAEETARKVAEIRKFEILPSIIS